MTSDVKDALIYSTYPSPHGMRASLYSSSRRWGAARCAYRAASTFWIC